MSTLGSLLQQKGKKQPTGKLGGGQTRAPFEPLVHHLLDEYGRLRDALLRDEQAAVGDAAVEPLAEQQLLLARLSVGQHTGT